MLLKLVLEDYLFHHAFCCYDCKYLKGNILGLNIWFRSFKYSMWNHKVNLCRLCIEFVLKWFFYVRCKKEIVWQHMGKYTLKVWGKWMQWETVKLRRAATFSSRHISYNTHECTVARIRCLFMSKVNQIETIFNHFVSCWFSAFSHYCAKFLARVLMICIFEKGIAITILNLSAILS